MFEFQLCVSASMSKCVRACWCVCTCETCVRACGLVCMRVRFVLCECKRVHVRCERHVSVCVQVCECV